MYDLDIIQASTPQMKKIENLPAFRMLLQNDAPANDITLITTTDAPANNTNISHNTTNLITTDNSNSPSSSAKKTDAPTELHISGMGVAGIAVAIVFLVPVLIGCMAIMSIFVNTKFIDQPLKIKIME
jgi:hypothetical protein